MEEIAVAVGVRKRSVRILKEPPIVSLESAPTPRSRGIGRPRTVAVFQPEAERILEEDASLLTVEVLSRFRSLDYADGKSAVYELVRSIRPTKADAPQAQANDRQSNSSGAGWQSYCLHYQRGARPDTNRIGQFRCPSDKPDLCVVVVAAFCNSHNSQLMVLLRKSWRIFRDRGCRNVGICSILGQSVRRLYLAMCALELRARP